MNFRLIRAKNCELTCVKPWSSRQKFFLPENIRKKINKILSSRRSQQNIHILVCIYDAIHSAQGRNTIFESRMTRYKERAGTMQVQRN
jgi:hypothetical protein